MLYPGFPVSPLEVEPVTNGIQQSKKIFFKMLLRIDDALKNAHLLRVTRTIPCCLMPELHAGSRLLGKTCSVAEMVAQVPPGWERDASGHVQSWQLVLLSPGLWHRCAAGALQPSSAWHSARAALLIWMHLDAGCHYIAHMSPK